MIKHFLFNNAYAILALIGMTRRLLQRVEGDSAIAMPSEGKMIDWKGRLL